VPLAETDDSRQGLTALLVTLACFGAAAYTVEFLFLTPGCLLPCPGTSSFAPTMLGALSERYATSARRR
jgi:uncharacterized membrane protein YccC